MAKLTRYHQPIFCATGATGSIAQFGSVKTGTPVYTDDPDSIQNTTAWTNGFTSALYDNKFPTIQDLNGLFYLFSRQINYLMQNPIPDWNASVTYYIGSFVSNTDGSIFYCYYDESGSGCLNKAVTNGSYWVRFAGHSTINLTTESSYTVLNDDALICWTDIGSKSKYLTLPAANISKGRCINVYSNLYTNSYLYITSPSGGLDIYGPTTFDSEAFPYVYDIACLSDGVKWAITYYG